ncbi:MAG: DNA polymerase III subunit delta' [Desulfobacterales bacterium]|nr:DNA polymerase III subunit delta' [Desulfobacterales bacterium]
MHPYSFANIIGQDKAKNLLITSFSRKKMAHAYLFRGPDGVGKKRLALTMAAFINCNHPRGTDVCGNCSSCRKFNADSHPDLLHIRPDGAGIKIKQIRELKHALTFPPFEARTRVVILEDVHTMRREAANSLLKTLEEPPADNLLILTADESGVLLPTIVSRCQVIPFHALPYELVAQALCRDHDLDPAGGATLAALSEGSLGRAGLLLDQELLDLRQELIENLVRLSPADPESVGMILRLAERAAALKEQLGELLGMLKTWFRDLMLLAGGGPQELVTSQDLAAILDTAGRRWNMAELQAKLKMIQRAEKELHRNCNRTLVCEVLFWGLL